MKLSSRDAPGHFAKPPKDFAGTLIYGADTMRVSLRRQELIRNLIGPEGEAEMRLSRVDPGELRRDPAQIFDALKEQGFFPGPRAVLVDGAGAPAAEAVAKALDGWRSGDAHLVVTAGTLKPTSPMRKGFEKHPRAAAIGLYDDPPDRAEIERMLKESGLGQIPQDALAELTALALQIPPGDFRQTLEKLALYKLNDDTPLGSEDIAAIAPATREAAVDGLVRAVAEMEAQQVAPLLRRLEGQGVNAVSIVIALQRHFRQVFAVATDPGGPGQGIGRLRPPVFGPRRDALMRQARAWKLERLDEAMRLLTQIDLDLRSAARLPAMALVERSLIRLCMLGRR